jgi:ABC-type multidrug transport system permease subunit
MLISFLKTTRQAGPVAGGVLTVTGMLGGLLTVGTDMPAAFQTVNLALPQGWALQGWRLALAGAGVGEILTSVGVLLAMGALFFAVGLRQLRRRFA